jgi:hypothetical protein
MSNYIIGVEFEFEQILLSTLGQRLAKKLKVYRIEPKNAISNSKVEFSIIFCHSNSYSKFEIKNFIFEKSKHASIRTSLEEIK